MKKLLFILLFVNLLFANENSKKLTIQLSWFDQFQFAGYYMAKEKGFYENVGLDVQIKAFEFGIDIPQSVSDGKFDFAVGRETLILDRANKKDIVALYALFQSSPLILISTKDSDINQISDFENKKIMTTIDDAGEVSIKAMITSQKLDIKNLNFIKHTHNINDLIDKKTDVISAYSSKSPFHLEKMGVEYNVFAPKDFGFDMYSDLLYTSETLIENDVQSVISFKNASLKGWEYAYNNIEETVDLILKKYNSQNLTREELIFEAEELKKLSFFKTNILGEIKHSKLQRIHDLYNIMGLLPKKIDINSFIFNQNDFFNSLTKEERNFISSNTIVKVGVENNRRPFSYIDGVGIQKGIIKDYLDIISQKTGLKFVYENEKQDLIIEKFKSNNIDMLALSSKVNLANSLITESYFFMSERFFRLKDRTLRNINKIGVLSYNKNKRKKTYLQKEYPSSLIFEFENLDDAIDALLNKKVELLYISEELMLNHIKENHITQIDFFENTIVNLTPLSMHVNENLDVLNSILSKAIQSVPSEQTLAIHNKWVPLMFQKKIDWNQIILIGFILTLIIMYMIYKQVILQRTTDKLKKSEDALLKANEELKELSQRDHLTKLFNRRYFESISKEYLQLAKRENKPTAMLIFDIDDFKKINDTYGHKAGDVVLVSMSKLIKDFVRQSDIVARIGGEEFVVLLPNTDLEGAKSFSESLREEIEKTSFKIDSLDLELKVTVSMGLTLFKNKETIYDTLHRADIGLYESKRAGKNRLTCS